MMKAQIGAMIMQDTGVEARFAQASFCMNVTGL